MNRARTSQRRLRERVLAGLLACVWGTGAIAAAPCAPTTTLAGSNIAGGEFNAGKQPGSYARDYIYPQAGDLALSRKLGLKAVRIPFLWERLQPVAATALDAAELARLDAAVDAAMAAGLTVVLDVHNYGHYQGRSVVVADPSRGPLPDLWKRLAAHYKDRPSIAFGLMNEPNDIEVDAWAAAATAALSAIRATGATNVVLVPGTHWDGAHTWFDGPPGHSSADTLLPLSNNDPNVVFEVHQYFDDNFSGTAPTCGGAARAVQALTRVGAWAREHRVRLFLGEFGVSQRPECVRALDDALAVVERDGLQWWGWTYWAAGAWWGDYPFNIQASNGETPQGRVLRDRATTLERTQCEKPR